MLVEIKQAYKSIEKIKELFKEYTDMTPKEFLSRHQEIAEKGPD